MAARALRSPAATAIASSASAGCPAERPLNSVLSFEGTIVSVRDQLVVVVVVAEEAEVAAAEGVGIGALVVGVENGGGVIAV
jgi:hypothetical protein